MRINIVLNCKCSQFTINAKDYFAKVVTRKELEQDIKQIEDKNKSVGS